MNNDIYMYSLVFEDKKNNKLFDDVFIEFKNFFIDNYFGFTNSLKHIEWKISSILSNLEKIWNSEENNKNKNDSGISNNSTESQNENKESMIINKTLWIIKNLIDIGFIEEKFLDKVNDKVNDKDKRWIQKYLLIKYIKSKNDFNLIIHNEKIIGFIYNEKPRNENEKRLYIDFFYKPDIINNNLFSEKCFTPYFSNLVHKYEGNQKNSNKQSQTNQPLKVISIYRFLEMMKVNFNKTNYFNYCFSFVDVIDGYVYKPYDEGADNNNKNNYKNFINNANKIFSNIEIRDKSIEPINKEGRFLVVTNYSYNDSVNFFLDNNIKIDRSSSDNKIKIDKSSSNDNSNNLFSKDNVWVFEYNSLDNKKSSDDKENNKIKDYIRMYKPNSCEQHFFIMTHELDLKLNDKEWKVRLWNIMYEENVFKKILNKIKEVLGGLKEPEVDNKINIIYDTIGKVIWITYKDNNEYKLLLNEENIIDKYFVSFDNYDNSFFSIYLDLLKENDILLVKSNKGEEFNENFKEFAKKNMKIEYKNIASDNNEHNNHIEYDNGVPKILSYRWTKLINKHLLLKEMILYQSDINKKIISLKKQNKKFKEKYKVVKNKFVNDSWNKILIFMTSFFLSLIVNMLISYFMDFPRDNLSFWILFLLTFVIMIISPLLMLLIKIFYNKTKFVEGFKSKLFTKKMRRNSSDKNRNIDKFYFDENNIMNFNNSKLMSLFIIENVDSNNVQTIIDLINSKQFKKNFNYKIIINIEGENNDIINKIKNSFIVNKINKKIDQIYNILPNSVICNLYVQKLLENILWNSDRWSWTKFMDDEDRTQNKMNISNYSFRRNVDSKTMMSKYVMQCIEIVEFFAKTQKDLSNIDNYFYLVDLDIDRAILKYKEINFNNITIKKDDKDYAFSSLKAKIDIRKILIKNVIKILDFDFYKIYFNKILTKFPEETIKNNIILNELFQKFENCIFKNKNDFWCFEDCIYNNFEDCIYNNEDEKIKFIKTLIFYLNKDKYWFFF